MVTANRRAANLLSGSFGIDPSHHGEYVVPDPVLIVSHNNTYYAPEEMLAVPLWRPQIVTFGRFAEVDAPSKLPRIHLVLPDVVPDRVQGHSDRVTQKCVRVGDLHGAIIFRDDTLVYRHCCNEPTLIAERILDNTRIVRPNIAVPLRLGQTIGLGATEDAFGGVLWWYYFRICSLSQLQRRVASHGN